MDNETVVSCSRVQMLSRTCFPGHDPLHIKYPLKGIKNAQAVLVWPYQQMLFESSRWGFMSESKGVIYCNIRNVVYMINCPRQKGFVAKLQWNNNQKK